MSRFNKGKKEMPELNTSSLPDLIFSVLFFFMMVTTMREVTYLVKFDRPSGTQLEKLARKSCTSFIYIGRPSTDALRSQYGNQTKIQLNDAIVTDASAAEYLATRTSVTVYAPGSMLKAPVSSA